jgi:hypothetical protein
VTNGDGILADQNVFDQEPHDFLAINDTKRFRRTAQASKKCCESLCQAQECGAIVGLVGDRLQLSTECLLTMTQCRHTFTQLLKRQESFLIGGEKSFDTFANMSQLPLQTLLTFCGWIGSTRCFQPTRRLLNQTANAAVKAKGSIFEIIYRRCVPRLGHNQAIGVIAHRQCRLIWLILHQGTRYEERGPAVTKRSRYQRTWRMIRQLRNLGYRIELPNPQASQAPA